MNNKMDPRVQFSALAGLLVLEQVPGVNKANWEPENDTAGGAGQDRTMYLYAPKSGLPDPKQTQVLLVLRDRNCECSAESLMKDLGLDTLAEEEHFILCFPNPTDEGWNYDNDPARDNDIDYLNRCFAAMKPGKVKVSGFNGKSKLWKVAEVRWVGDYSSDACEITPKFTDSGYVVGTLSNYDW